MEKLARLLKTLCLAGATTVVAGCGDSLLEPEELLPQVAEFSVLLNDHRVSVGCQPFEWRSDVAEVALAHSRDMIARDFFAHTNPDGASPFDRMRDAGIDFSLGAENIAWGYPSAGAVLDGWLNSAGHRANIENCALTEHGVGLEGTHWTHLFITP